MTKTKLLVIGILGVLAGCGGGANLISGPDLFTYVGSSQVTSNNPMKFSATITISNPTNSPVTFTTSCPIPQLLVYTNANLTGTPVYNSNTRANLPSCSSQQVTLNQNKSVSYSINLNGADVLGASGNPGTYYLAIAANLDGAPYVVPAGSIALAR